MARKSPIESARKDADRTLSLKRVLVVEDDAILSMLIESELRAHGVEDVVVCPSIAATMEELERAAADALVLDVHLSDRDDGYAVAELVSLLGPKSPRIVFSTGAPDDIPPDIAELGPVLAKPYDPEDLIAALDSKARPGVFARLRSKLG